MIFYPLLQSVAELVDRISEPDRIIVEEDLVDEEGIKA